ncbi:MAG TPA: hypothetical protein DIS78_04010 [Lachnospiraceae bacterium]|nr:hypothetical protein [Lachnospiraceae bacterium]
MNSLVTAVNMLRFTSSYITIKALLSVMFATVIMGLIVPVRLINKRKIKAVDYYSTLLVIPMMFTGMSRLFYMVFNYYKAPEYEMSRVLAKVYNFVFEAADTWFGWIYAGVMLTLLIRYVARHNIHNHRVRGLERADADYTLMIVKAIDEVSGGKISKHRLEKVRLYIARENISPYSGGVLRPYVVMPERSMAEVNDREYFIMLCHELMHIRKWHILWLTMYDLACIWWWFDPFIYLFREIYRDDMEMVCDENCISSMHLDAKEYARTIFSMLVSMQRKNHTIQVINFISDYNSQRRRIEAIAGYSSNKEGLRRLPAAVMIGVFVILSVTVCCLSYPRYTNMTEIALYDIDEARGDANDQDDKGLFSRKEPKLNVKTLEYDTERIRRAVEVHNGSIKIKDQELFGRILDEHGIDKDYVYISFGGYMKIPGIGGGGNTGMVNTKDYDDIFYLADDSVSNDIMEFLLKII